MAKSTQADPRDRLVCCYGSSYGPYAQAVAERKLADIARIGRCGERHEIKVASSRPVTPQERYLEAIAAEQDDDSDG